MVKPAFIHGHKPVKKFLYIGFKQLQTVNSIFFQLKAALGPISQKF